MRWSNGHTAIMLAAAMILGAVVLVTTTLGACSTARPATDRGSTLHTPITRTPTNALSLTRDGEPTVRVRVADAGSAVLIGGWGNERPLRLRAMHDPAWSLDARAPLIVRVEKDAWVIGAAAPDRTIAEGGVIARLRRATQRPHLDALRVVALDEGSRYDPGLSIETRDGDDQGWVGALRDGELFVHANEDAETIDVVPHVPMESYVLSVVAAELFAGWETETYAAQAVAARSYALHEAARARADERRHHDVEATTRDQVFGGSPGSPTARAGVRQTRGRFLTWRGDVLRAYYSSTTGGRAAGAAEVWPTGPGFEFNLADPIQASPRDDADAFSPRARWTVERDAGELAQRLRAFGERNNKQIRELDSLRAIEALERNDFDRPTVYKVTQRDGTWYTLSAEYLRRACNAGAPGLPRITASERVLSGDIEVDISNGVATITGRGFGHGVGMSQYGAEGMARRGITHADILAHYYPGATVVTLYD